MYLLLLANLNNASYFSWDSTILASMYKVRNNESLYDKQIHFASSLLRVVPTKDQTNDVYNT